MGKTLKMIQGEAVSNAWNDHHPPGREVVLVNNAGQQERTVTRSKAWTLRGGSPVVSVKGKTGGYALERVVPVREARLGGESSTGPPCTMCGRDERSHARWNTAPQGQCHPFTTAKKAWTIE